MFTWRHKSWSVSRLTGKQWRSDSRVTALLMLLMKDCDVSWNLISVSPVSWRFVVFPDIKSDLTSVPFQTRMQINKFTPKGLVSICWSHVCSFPNLSQLAQTRLYDSVYILFNTWLFPVDYTQTHTPFKHLYLVWHSISKKLKHLFILWWS